LSVPGGPGLVLDASVAIAAVQREERTAEAEAIVRRYTPLGIVVPVLWHVEVGNILLLAERRQRLSAEGREAHLRDLAALPISVDYDGHGVAWGAAMALAQRHRLTLYDGLYLELAVRLRVPLATFDAALVRAAAAEGVTVA